VWKNLGDDGLASNRGNVGWNRIFHFLADPENDGIE
jgi:hypothetical protein